MPATRSDFVTKLQFPFHKRNFRYTSAAHQSVMPRPQINPDEIPNYTIEESARYLHVDYEKIRYWVVGDERAAPLSTVFTRRPFLLSFKNLVECFVLESLRKIHNVSLQEIRNSIEQLRIGRQSKYPLADYTLHTEKGKLIYLDERGDQLVCLSRGGQMVFRDILLPFLRRVERNERGIAQRLFPFTRREHLKSPSEAPRVVMIDPQVAFGMPVLVNSRISTAFLMSRKKGGASVKQLAADYGRPETEIEEAIRLEEAA
ncbi:MAG TPA: DUF433 domain-containing protein [Candidatus Sulfotelmatobacter sp.]|nr:DUF433 domain-containing protein [Candidatus Sulfotelmatobacter sp.]